MRYPIAKLRNRMQRLNRRWEKGHEVIEARAADPAMQNVPGGPTGLLVRTYKQIGVGRDAETVEEYAVDTATLRELREMEKQAAQELGQWNDDHAGQELTQKLYIGIQIEQI